MRYLEDYDRPLSSTTELRVHGTGGTPPEDLLADPHPVRVSGDETAGFLRPESQDSDLEAYSWRGMTSGGGFLSGLLKGLWVLALPFALINAAGWMIGRDRREALSGPTRRQQGLIRVLGLATTAVSVAWVMALSNELLTGGCLAQATCASRWDWATGFFAGRPTRLSALALAVAGLASLPVVFFTRTANRAYDSFAETAETRQERESSRRDAGELRLADQTMWESAERVTTLRRLHVAGAAAVAGLVMSGALWWVWSYRGRGDGPPGVVVLLPAVCSAMSLYAVWRVAARPLQPRGARLLEWTALLLFVTVLAVFLSVGPAAGFVEPGDVRLAVNRALLLFVAAPMAGLLVLLVALLMAPCLRHGGWQQLPRAVLPAVVIGCGWLVGGGIITACGWFAAALLGQSLFWEYRFVAVVLVIAAALALATALFISAFFCYTARSRRSGLLAEYWASTSSPQPVPDLDRHLPWAAKTARLRRLEGEVPRRFVPLLVGLALPAAAALGWYVVGLANAPSFDALQAMVGHLGFSPYVLALVPPTLIAFAWKASRSQATRRQAGHIWDVLNFWPNWYQPFAPPTYGARAVPELRLRIMRLAGFLGDPPQTDHRKVILAGHSQGSVIAAATVAQLWGHRALDRVALLTFGSPIARIYSWVFPAYFGPDQLSLLASSLTAPGAAPRWRNLYRQTDPISGPIFLAANASVDQKSPDPWPRSPVAGEPLPKPKGHSWYWEDPPYRAAKQHLLDLI